MLIQLLGLSSRTDGQPGYFGAGEKKPSCTTISEQFFFGQISEFNANNIFWIGFVDLLCKFNYYAVRRSSVCLCVCVCLCVWMCVWLWQRLEKKNKFVFFAVLIEQAKTIPQTTSIRIVYMGDEWHGAANNEWFIYGGLLLLLLPFSVCAGAIFLEYIVGKMRGNNIAFAGWIFFLYQVMELFVSQMFG